MKTHTKIVKEKLKEIEELEYRICLPIENKPQRLITLKATLSGMQTAIKSELEFLLPTQKMRRESTFSHKIDERITDCKNALKLIEEGK